jgi:hypothetical protein
MTGPPRGTVTASKGAAFGSPPLTLLSYRPPPRRIPGQLVLFIATTARPHPLDRDPPAGPAMSGLAKQHRQLLEDSAVSPEVARERGYRTATRKAELETLGFARYQCIVPSLVIPIRNAAGEIINYQVRPDQPRIGDNGKPVKYESPAGIPPTLDVPPRVAGALGRAHNRLDHRGRP